MMGARVTEKCEADYPEISRTILLAFCGYVIVWYLQVGLRIPALGAIRLEYVYAILLTLVSFFCTPKLDTNCPLLYYLILYLLVILVQIPFSCDFNTSWLVFVDRIMKFAFISFFIVSFVRSPTDLRYFLAAFLLACLKMGQEGMVGKISGGLIWESQGVMRLHGSTPMYQHPNSFSGMAIGTLPFVYYLWPLSNKYVKFVLLLLGLFALNIVVFSGSRTGYVGFVFFLLLMYYNSNNKRKLVLTFAVLSMITLPMIPGDYIERFNSIFTRQDKEGHSIEARVEILSDAWLIFQEHPLGVGVSAFPKVRMDRFGRSQDTHNLYLEVATNLGVQGIVVFSLLIFKMLALLNEVRRSARECLLKIDPSGNKGNITVFQDLRLIESVALATITFIYLRLILGLFGMDLYEIYWWFAIGITFSLYSMMNRIKKTFFPL